MPLCVLLFLHYYLMTKPSLKTFLVLHLYSLPHEIRCHTWMSLDPNCHLCFLDDISYKELYFLLYGFSSCIPRGLPSSQFQVDYQPALYLCRQGVSRKTVASFFFQFKKVQARHCPQTVFLRSFCKRSFDSLGFPCSLCPELLQKTSIN